MPPGPHGPHHVGPDQERIPLASRAFRSFQAPLFLSEGGAYLRDLRELTMDPIMQMA